MVSVSQLQVAQLAQIGGSSTKQCRPGPGMLISLFYIFLKRMGVEAHHLFSSFFLHPFKKRRVKDDHHQSASGCRLEAPKRPWGPKKKSANYIFFPYMYSSLVYYTASIR